ncbi:MAG: DUF1587 domain-containing protein, partial [Planctomycetales bacterium]
MIPPILIPPRTVSLLSVLMLLTSLGVSTPASADDYETSIKPLLRKYCVKCHGGGKEISGEVDFTKINSRAEIDASFEVWESAVELVADGSMPPEKNPQPSAEEKAKLQAWYHGFLDSVTAHPGFFRARRLSAHEYRNTLESLVGFRLEVAVREAEQTVAETSLVMKLLPTDPPGPSGFTNDTSDNPLTTVTWDQYSYLTDNALAKLFSPRRRKSLEVYAGPIKGKRLTAEQAARVIRAIA